MPPRTCSWQLPKVWPKTSNLNPNQMRSTISALMSESVGLKYWLNCGIICDPVPISIQGALGSETKNTYIYIYIYLYISVYIYILIYPSYCLLKPLCNPICRGRRDLACPRCPESGLSGSRRLGDMVWQITLRVRGT